ncbi:MAG TPA: G5 domain-containing protein [Candidatus Saccharimonadales bacterium]|nr:G5 domain-containing protein [Candidatus Saccharimonadales bacterium]
MQKKLRQFHKLYKAEREAKAAAIKGLKVHPIVLPIITFLSLAVLSTAVFLLLNGGSPAFKPISSYIVIISNNGHQELVPTREPTIGALLAKINLKLNPGDVVEPSASTPITQDELRVNIYRAVPVEIIDGSQITYTFSAASTPRSIAQQAGITVYPQDYISSRPVANFAVANSVDNQVIIDPATPVYLNLYGTPTNLRTHATTIGQLLSQEDIKLGTGDSVQPGISTPITPDLQIFLIHQGTKIENVQQTIATPITTIQDDSLSFGTSAVRQQGSSGQEVLTYQLNYVNGVEVSQSLIQTVVTQPPVPEIVAEGQAVQIPADKEAVMAEAGISSSDYAYVNYIVSNESGWCPTKVQGDIGYCPGYAPSAYILSEEIGYGLGQATPGEKMASFGSDWETNPVTQLKWATYYANSRYGSWEAAYDHWQAYGNW